MKSNPDESIINWSEPGVQEVARGVFRIPLPLPNDALKAVNVYAIRNSKTVTLVDSGWALAESRQALGDAMKSMGAELGDIDVILVTHIHRDHFTQAIKLREEFGVNVRLGEGERSSLELLTSPDHVGLSSQMSLLRLYGASEIIQRLMTSGFGAVRSKAQWEMPDEWLSNRLEIELESRTLRVVNTPGHTRGHVVFVDESNSLLFAGDHVLPRITPSLGFEAAPSRFPLENYLASLRIIELMPDMRLLPAHGPVTPSTHVRVKELVTHHQDRLVSALNSVTNSNTSVWTVARNLRWTSHARELDSLDPFNQMLAVLETAAHLEMLVVRGDLSSSVEDGIVYFALREA